MVKRLRRRPLTAKTGVRVPVGLPILTQLFKLGFLQRCLSGLRSTIGNRVYFIRVPRVQIPLSAPCTRCLISDGFLLATALRSVCVQKPCRAATGATLRERYCRNNVTRSAFHAAIAVLSRHPPLLTNPALCATKKGLPTGSPFLVRRKRLNHARYEVCIARPACTRVGSRERAPPATLSRGDPYGVSAVCRYTIHTCSIALYY